MKTVFVCVMAMALAAAAGCQSVGARGGSASAEEGFKIGVPSTETDVKQGQLQTVTISLQRGDYFKQDVSLDIKTTAGITIQPATIMVKAGDSPDVQLQILATKDAALGECRVSVVGTPATGEPTSADFNVMVVTQ